MQAFFLRFVKKYQNAYFSKLKQLFIEWTKELDSKKIKVYKTHRKSIIISLNIINL